MSNLVEIVLFGIFKRFQPYFKEIAKNLILTSANDYAFVYICT